MPELPLPRRPTLPATLDIVFEHELVPDGTMSSTPTPIGDLYSSAASSPTYIRERGPPAPSALPLSSRRSSENAFHSVPQQRSNHASPNSHFINLPVVSAPAMGRGSSGGSERTAETYMTGGEGGPDTPATGPAGLPHSRGISPEPMQQYSPQPTYSPQTTRPPGPTSSRSGLDHIFEAGGAPPSDRASTSAAGSSEAGPSTIAPSIQKLHSQGSTSSNTAQSHATSANISRGRNGSATAGLGVGYPSVVGGGGEMNGSNGPQLSPGLDDPLVSVGFDEGVLRALCSLDCGVPLLLDRLKQALMSNREMQAFLRKRAQIEEEYARSMQKLVRERSEAYSSLGGESRAGSYVKSWQSLLKVHDFLADNRLKYSQQLVEMCDELGVLAREVEKSRKGSKDMGGRLEKSLQESESATEKARQRFDAAAEELERLIVAKSGESVKDLNNVPHLGSGASGPAASSKRTFGKAMSKLKAKNPAQLAKQEDETRSRMGRESDAYRGQVLATQQVRQEYFNLQLPRLLRSLKEQSDEIDNGSQYHLLRYAHLSENLTVNDGVVLAPVSLEEGPGIKGVVEAIDNREDFRSFMSNYAAHFNQSGQKGLRREGPPDEGFVANMGKRPSVSSSPRPSTSAPLGPGPNKPPPPVVSRPTFGVDLGEQMLRDGVEVPRILEECAAVIEEHGLDTIGIYRLSGMTSRVQRLKAKLDRDVESVDLTSEENLTDINDISGVLKLWLRELPEPLMTWDLYHGIIEAASGSRRPFSRRCGA